MTIEIEKALKIPTPTCELTGLPLPIAPAEAEMRELDFPRTFHHHFHPERAPELSRGTLGGRALRFSRGQVLEEYLHKRYHKLFAGPPLPQTDEERFKLTVLSCARVMPLKAIDLNNYYGDYSVVNLSADDRNWLSRPPITNIEMAHHPTRNQKRRREIGRFFADYALQKDIRALIDNKPLVDKFLSSRTSPADKARLGNAILHLASIQTVKEVVPAQDLHELGIMGDQVRRVFRTVGNFFTGDYYPDYYRTMQERLEVA